MEYHSTRAIQISCEEFLELEFHLMETRPGANPDAFVGELVKLWLAMEKQRLALQKNGPELRGFQWKTVFLPAGTDLRTSHGDTVAFAKVVGDHIVSEDGRSVTPSEFANRCKGEEREGRNAWRFVWLRFPGERHWFRASDCREHAKAESLKRHRS